MTKLDFENKSQSWFKKLCKSAFCYLVVTATLAHAVEERQSSACSECPESPEVLAFQSLESLNKLRQQVLPADSPNNCFNQLTDSDKIFLEELLQKVRMHCGVENAATKTKFMAPLKRIPASSDEQQLEKVSAECAASAQVMMFQNLEDYGKNFGTAAKRRTTTALLAHLQGLQITNILRDFEDPILAPSFHKFTEAVYNYDQSLKKVLYQDINKDQSIHPKDSILSWFYQRGSMAKDLFLTKTNLADKTRFREQQVAAEKLLFSGIALNKKIQSANFSTEKKQQLLQQVSAFNNLMRDRYYQSKNAINEEAQLATLATSGFISSVLIVVSLGSYSPSFLWAGSAADFLSASLSMAAYSAMGSAGVNGAVEVSRLILVAKTAAKDNASRFLCELAQKMYSEEKKPLEVLKNALTTAQLGAAIGGSAFLLSGQSKVREYGILLGVLGAVAGLNLTKIKNKLDQREDIDGERAAARLQYEASRLSYGELLDSQNKSNLKEAHNSAELLGLGINVSRLGYFFNDIPKAIVKEKIKNDMVLNAVRTLEIQLGRNFSEIQNKAVLGALNLRVKESKVNKKLSDQELKVMSDLKNAGFSAPEIKSILNFNTTKIIPSAHSD